MDRKEAIEIVRKNYPHVGFSGSEFETALRELVPEFKEQPDPRHSLIEFIKWSCDRGCITPEQRKNIDFWLAYLEKQKEQNIYKSSKSEIDFADRYSKDVWEKLMSKFKAVEGYSIGCNDVSDIVLNAILNAFKWQKEQKSAEWSEEDSRIIYNVIAYVGYAAGQRGVRDDAFKEANSWLKSLPERFNPQPKQEWSEEDEKILKDCIDMPYSADFISRERKKDAIRWLKSLRPQPHWKPSKEQISALERAVVRANTANDIPTLTALRDNLKKL